MILLYKTKDPITEFQKKDKVIYAYKMFYQKMKLKTELQTYLENPTKKHK